MLMVLLVATLSAQPQSYPRWFLEQGTLLCKLSAAGYSPLWLSKDSSLAQAARDARGNLVRQRETVVELGQAFWTTEAGTSWMGGEFKLSIDSSAYLKSLRDASAVTVCFCSDFVIALASDGASELPDLMKETVRMPKDEPGWVRETPSDATRYYSVGVSPRYFYEMSSWMSAERMALIGLAKAGGDSLAAIEKSAAGSGQEVLSEEATVAIHYYQVNARWCDEANGVFYVLMSAEKDDVNGSSVRYGTR